MTTAKKYFGIWEKYEDVVDSLANTGYSNSQEQDRKNWRENNPNFPTDKEILWAAYDYEDYSGSATIFFKKNGKLMEYGGSHCSCNGLEEDAFSATETSWEALAMRNPDGSLYGYGAHDSEAIEAIKALVDKNEKKPKKGTK